MKQNIEKDANRKNLMKTLDIASLHFNLIG
jgi:hypothetical protein